MSAARRDDGGEADGYKVLSCFTYTGRNAVRAVAPLPRPY
jgi:23S rRNA G2069 N7-methylase RlmK/C1962 C5-methylase RlmI